MYFIREKMKLFGFHILKQKTLDGRLAEAHKKAIAIPNKMISRLLSKQAEKPMVKQLLSMVFRLKRECEYLRDKM